jgi:hypothetical protein
LTTWVQRARTYRAKTFRSVTFHLSRHNHCWHSWQKDPNSHFGGKFSGRGQPYWSFFTPFIVFWEPGQYVEIHTYYDGHTTKSTKKKTIKKLYLL